MNKKAILFLSISFLLGVESFASGSSIYGTYESENCRVDIIKLEPRDHGRGIYNASEILIRAEDGEEYSFRIQDDDIPIAQKRGVLGTGNGNDHSGQSLTMELRSGQPISLRVREYSYLLWIERQKTVLECESLRKVSI